LGNCNAERLSPKVANAIGYLAGVLLKASEVAESQCEQGGISVEITVRRRSESVHRETSTENGI
jgi:hypothetical protein